MAACTNWRLSILDCMNNLAAEYLRLQEHIGGRVSKAAEQLDDNNQYLQHKRMSVF